MKLSDDLNKDELFDHLCESLNYFQEKITPIDGHLQIMKQLYKTMDEKHIKFFNSELKKDREAQKIGKRYKPNTLCEIISWMIIIHLQYRSGMNSIIPGPLSLPPEVAEVWIQRESGGPTFQCPGCKYNWLPCLENSTESYFKICPICKKNLKK